jgi:hypothetical protein
MTWALLRDDAGVLRREEMRGMYDGESACRAPRPPLPRASAAHDWRIVVLEGVKGV